MAPAETALLYNVGVGKLLLFSHKNAINALHHRGVSRAGVASCLLNEPVCDPVQLV